METRGPGWEVYILQILFCRLQPGGHLQISPTLEFAPNEEAMRACKKRSVADAAAPALPLPPAHVFI